MTIDPLTSILIPAAIAVVVALITSRASLTASEKAGQIQIRIATEQQTEIRKTRHHEFLLKLLGDLQTATYNVEAIFGRNDLESWLEGDLQQKGEYARAMGQAAAVCLASGNPELQKIQKEQMTPYLVENHRNINRAALHEALQVLAQMINDLNK